jgi:hypothetical protein
MPEYDIYKFDAACKKLGATPDDVRRLIVLAAQRNHIAVSGLKLGALKLYANKIVKSVQGIEEEAYLPGACSTRDAAMRKAERIRREIVLSGVVSPDAGRVQSTRPRE